MLTRATNGERLDPLDARDWIGFAKRGDDRVQVREIVHLDVQMESLEAAVAMDQLKVDDVGVLGAKDSGHGPKSTGDVAKDHGEARGAAV